MSLKGYLSVCSYAPKLAPVHCEYREQPILNVNIVYPVGNICACSCDDEDDRIIKALMNHSAFFNSFHIYFILIKFILLVTYLLLRWSQCRSH